MVMWLQQVDIFPPDDRELSVAQPLPVTGHQLTDPQLEMLGDKNCVQ
jgi:hypothetical protein